MGAHELLLMLALVDEIAVIGTRAAVTTVAEQCTSGGRPPMDEQCDRGFGGSYADDIDR